MQQRIQYLLKRYASQKASTEEENELWAYIDEAQWDGDTEQAILSLMESEESGAQPDREQWEPVLRKVIRQVQNEDIEGAPVYQLNNTTKHIGWKRMAAAAVIFLLAGTGLFYFLGNSPADEKLLAIENTLLKADVAPPGSVNATLTLSNGIKIVLDSAGNGMLAQQGDVNVMKLSDGQIVYNPMDIQEHNGEVMYNTLTNPRGSKPVKIVLAEGSKVWLNTESSLRYPTAFTGTERKVEITGEAYFEVAHNDAMPFRVSVNAMEVEVLGTHFNINSYQEEKETRTTLLEGSIKVKAGSVSRIIKPGEQARVHHNSKQALLISSPDIAEVMAWKEGRFSFSNADLETIMREMARWYNVEVEYKDQIKDRYTVNVSRDVPVSQLFQFIEMTGGVHFEIKERKIVVRK